MPQYAYRDNRWFSEQICWSNMFVWLGYLPFHYIRKQLSKVPSCKVLGWFIAFAVRSNTITSFAKVTPDFLLDKRKFIMVSMML